MGAYTYADFKANLTRELWQRDDISTVVGAWVNAAYMDLATRNRFWDLKIPTNFEFPELNVADSRSTSDGVPYVLRPSETLHTYWLFDNTNKRKLVKISPREYFAKTDRSTLAAEGQPTNWTRYGTYLYLWPTPAATYDISVYYRRRPAAMSMEIDTTAIGAEWDEPILKLAVIQSMMRLKQYENAAMEKQEWMSKMQDLVGIYGKENLDREHIAKTDDQYHDFEY